MVTSSRQGPCNHSESRSSSGPPAAHGPLAGPAAGGAKVGMRRRVGPLRVAQLLQPARSQRSQEWSRGRRCRGVHATTSSFPLRLEQLLRPAYSPRSQEWSRGRRCRDAHASTRSLRGPSTPTPRPMVPVGSTADGAASYSAVQLHGVARARHTVPVGPAAGGAPRSMRLGAGHAETAAESPMA
jgi:hypothetical protein